MIYTDGTCTYINRYSSVAPFESIGISAGWQTNDSFGNPIAAALTNRFGNTSSVWIRQVGINGDTNSDWYGIRFPVPFETNTQSIHVAWFTGYRVAFRVSSEHQINSNNGNTVNAISGGSGNSPNLLFGVVDSHSITLVGFSSNNLATPSWFLALGWAHNPSYSSGNYPLNLYAIHSNTPTTSVSAYHPSAANSTTPQALLTSGTLAAPDIACAVATPGADSIQTILRRSTGSNIYIGNARNLIQVPNSLSFGAVYRNTGVDPSGLTGLSNFWMPVAQWGTRKLAMRVMTQNII